MSKRVDLTHFEGIEDRIKHCQQGKYPAEDLLQELALMAPNLIAELKRCYEEIDNLLKQECRLIDIAERGGAWEGNFDYSDINEKYGACQSCGSIPSGCCESASE